MQFGVVGLEIAHAGDGAHAEHARGLLGHQRQGAAFGVAAEQGALRTLQDFDALDVEQGGG